MQRLEQEIKELQAGLGSVVQALSFLQSFLESDYGLKFQFHAYCNSPLYSHNSNALDVLKQKYGGLNDNSGYANSTRVYHQSQQNSGAGDPQLVHVRFQTADTATGLESAVNVIESCTVGACTTQSLGQTFVTVTNAGDLAPAHNENLSDGLTDDQRTPIIVNDDEIHIFGISELASTMKEESHEMYQNSINAFAKQDFEENSESNDEEIKSIQSPDISVSKKLDDNGNPTTTNTKSKRGRSKKASKADCFQCPNCRRRFYEKARLQLHMTHHKQQFQCSECGVWLADKSVLNRHMRTHTGDRPFTCAYCNEAFTRQDIVKKHILRKHKDMVDNGNFLNGIKHNKPATTNGS